MKELKQVQKSFLNVQNKNVDNNIEISAIDLINLFINYKIPICKETIETIKKIPYYYIKK